MDTDVELGRYVAHGALAGGGKTLRDLVEADPQLTRREKDERQLVIALGELALHVLTEGVAAAVQADRDS
ncbi:MAG TPA: hypothetical protein VGS23_08660 [Thermoplasmata archaeon]|nr:hypothetical protein [Thermoplasmata archaeon]